MTFNSSLNGLQVVNLDTFLAKDLVQGLQEIQTEGVGVGGGQDTVQGSPLGVLLEKTHGLDVVVGVEGEAVVDTGGL
jgi:hypothetical protein